MRVAYLVAGAGRMYCGACMRDNRLVARLIQRGRDVKLIPLYTPIRTDEINVSERRVYYGAINVYLEQKFPFFRKAPWIVDRILNAAPLLRAVGRFVGKASADDLGSLTVSVLAGQDGAHRKEVNKLIVGLRELRPTLIHLPNLMFVGTVQALKASLNVPVLCTLAGEDVFLDALGTPYRDQALELIRCGAGHVDAFFAPTEFYASHASNRFGLDRSRVHYVPMGIRVDDIGPAAAPLAEPFTIGYLAAVCPEKGLARLCEAFMLLRKQNRNCRLRIAGYVGAAGRAYWADIHRRLHEQGLENAVDFLGEVTHGEKLRFLRSLHALSVPTVYPEAKGIYALEAMASGVPVVQPRHGSFPELVEATEGGLLYDPNGTEALASALASLMDREDLRARLAERGREAVHRLFTDEIMADEVWALYQRYGETRRA